MSIQELITQTQAGIAQTSLLEWIAVSFGVLQVLLARNNNVWLYLAGIVSTTLSIYILAKVQLYAESVLNLYYLVMSIYGWWYWFRNKNEPELPIQRADKKDWIITCLIVGVGWGVLYFALQQFTNSDVAGMDAWVSATAWAGMWLLARRRLENWILLNISNLFAIPLQIYKGIPLYALLTLVLFIVAISGYFKWQRIMQTKQAV
jgi:nicotinamide mononucleotide transporter